MAVMEYLTLFAIVLGVNLLPAFGPPTWSILVIFVLNTQLPPLPLILIAALAAALGRFALAHAFRLFARRLSAKTRRNLDAARAALQKNRRNAILALGLFALAPVPSAQLFEAAGLARVPLLGFTAAFFLGRTVSYSIYVLTAAGLRGSSLGDTFKAAITSPIGIIIQLAMIVALVAFARIDWAKRLGG